MMGRFAKKLAQGKDGEELFFDLALEDITRAADLFRPIHERTNTVDGWVSLEVSPMLAYDTKTTIQSALDLFKPSRPAKSVHKGSRDQGGFTCDRGVDLCRCAHKRDTAILPRALSCGGGGFPPWH